VNSLVILTSSIIITGIVSYFIHWGYRRTHVVYQEVIVCSVSKLAGTD
jgi:hypothetical protein